MSNFIPKVFAFRIYICNYLFNISLYSIFFFFAKDNDFLAKIYDILGVYLELHYWRPCLVPMATVLLHTIVTRRNNECYTAVAIRNPILKPYCYILSHSVPLYIIFILFMLWYKEIFKIIVTFSNHYKIQCHGLLSFSVHTLSAVRS